jgi:hypothetical protein
MPTSAFMKTDSPSLAEIMQCPQKVALQVVVCYLCCVASPIIGLLRLNEYSSLDLPSGQVGPRPVRGM